MKWALNRLKTGTITHLLVNANKNILINPQPNYDSSMMYIDQVSAANSGNNGDYGQLDEGPPSLKKKPSTNREMTAQKQLQGANLISGGKPPTIKSTRKPPKAPGANMGHSPQNLRSKFDKANDAFDTKEQSEPAVEDTNKLLIKKNAEFLRENKGRNDDSKKISKDAKKMIRSQHQLQKPKVGLLETGSKFNKLRDRSKNERKSRKVMEAIVLDKESDDGSELKKEPSESSQESYYKDIQSLNDFLEVFNSEVVEETTNEIHVKTSQYRSPIVVPKHIFAEI